jgi:hypothetical protein
MLCIYSSLWWCYYYAVAVLFELLDKGYLCIYILCMIELYEVGGGGGRDVGS